MNERPFIATVGSINMDLIVATPRVPARGENLLAHDLVVGLGGKGANPSVALARMGARSLLVGCVGADGFGRQAQEALRSEGVDVASLAVVGDAPTGVALIMVDDEGENTILVVNGANDRLTPSAVGEALAPHWGALDALLVNFEIPGETVAETVRLGRAHGVPVVVDAGPPRRRPEAVWGGATVLSPNALEAETLVGYPVDDEASARRAARDLLARGPQAVVLKRGAQGALLCTSQEERVIPGYSVDVVDTTGAGDAFTAGLTLAMAEGQALAEAVRWANACGALAVTRLGAMAAMPTRVEVEAFLAERGG